MLCSIRQPPLASIRAAVTHDISQENGPRVIIALAARAISVFPCSHETSSLHSRPEHRRGTQADPRHTPPSRLSSIPFALASPVAIFTIVTVRCRDGCTLCQWLCFFSRDPFRNFLRHNSRADSAFPYQQITAGDDVQNWLSPRI